MGMEIGSAEGRNMLRVFVNGMLRKTLGPVKRGLKETAQQTYL